MDSQSGANSRGKRTPGFSNRRFSVRQFFRDIRLLGLRRSGRRQRGMQHQLVQVSPGSLHVDEANTISSELLVVLIECPICTVVQPPSSFPRLASAQCQHTTCADCLHRYLTVEITESRTDISCPVCAASLHPDDIRHFLSGDPSLVHKYEEFMLRRALVVDPDVRWCPAPDCGYAVVASGCAGCPRLRCERPGCGTEFCYHCKQPWHASQTCAAARAKRLSSIHSMSSMSRSLDSSIASCANCDIKACPRCGVLIVKMDDGSCNHMTCTVCAAEFCWLCMQEISDIHYLSPSGCTFWGKKQWSRKKKVLLQLAMLVGGPIGISFIAVAAVPAIIIGLPVWVGRKLYQKFELHRRYQRVLAVLAGIVSSVIVAPLLSLLAVVIGVPLLLAYVYGIVPLSLCRSIGNCGIRTTSSGVQINVSEDDDCLAPGSLTRTAFQSTPTVGRECELGPAAGDDDASLQLMRGFTSSDGQIVSSGATGDQEMNYADSGHRRKVVIDGIFNRLEVHAEVSFNPSGSSRRSLGDASSGVPHCSVKGRSSATVSFSDIIRTSQDVDSDELFTPQASNMSLNSGSGSLSMGSRSVSVTGAGPASFMPRSIVRPGAFRSNSPPPLTKHSVNFARDLTRVGSSGRSADKQREMMAPAGRAPWTYKRHCMSVGDSIDERVESTDADYLSVRSLATPGGAAAGSVPKLEPCSGGSNIVAMIADAGNSSHSLATTRHQRHHTVAHVGASCGTMSSIDRASDCSSSLSTSSNAVFVPSSTQLITKDDLRRCFSGEIGACHRSNQVNAEN